MVEPKIVGAMLFFERLDRCRNLDGVYTLGWRFIDEASEEWTTRFNRFKYAKAQAIRGACASLPDAAKTISLANSSIVLVSAL
ncbi:MAG TPA: hypothetical protein VGS96_05195, partial [Thermoanaerobaculia bacterium]|nr:hypothetical protein [Thermoanaerobaculia bacterium]